MFPVRSGLGGRGRSTPWGSDARMPPAALSRRRVHRLSGAPAPPCRGRGAPGCEAAHPGSTPRGLFATGSRHRRRPSPGLMFGVGRPSGRRPRCGASPGSCTGDDLAASGRVLRGNRPCGRWENALDAGGALPIGGAPGSRRGASPRARSGTPPLRGEQGQRRTGGRRSDRGAGRFISHPRTTVPLGDVRLQERRPMGRSGAGPAGLTPRAPGRGDVLDDGSVRLS